MKFYCQHKEKNGDQCRRYTMTGRQYCRLHGIIRQVFNDGKSWNKILGIIFLGSGVFLLFQAFLLLSYFLATAQVAALFKLLVYTSFGGFVLSIAMIKLGSTRFVWALVYAISLGSSSILLALLTIIGALKPDIAHSLLSQLFPTITIQHPLFYISSAAVFATFLGMVFLSVVLLFNIPRTVYHLVLVIYLIAYVILLFLQAAPIGGMLYLLLIILYLLDNKYHWLDRIREIMHF